MQAMPLHDATCSCQAKCGVMGGIATDMRRQLRPPAGPARRRRRTAHAAGSLLRGGLTLATLCDAQQWSIIERLVIAPLTDACACACAGS